MDASGKDGTVKHVVGPVNPGGCGSRRSASRPRRSSRTTSCGASPTPCRQPGQLGVFNRSHYEDVLVVRVHELVPRAVWGRRFARINAWEKRRSPRARRSSRSSCTSAPRSRRSGCSSGSTTRPSTGRSARADIPERHRGPTTKRRTPTSLDRCSTDVAPWYVVPADRKWYRDWAVSNLLAETLRDLDLGWPVPEGIDLDAMRKELRLQSGDPHPGRAARVDPGQGARRDRRGAGRRRVRRGHHHRDLQAGGVSQGALFRYWPTKGALLADAAAHLLARVTTAYEQALAGRAVSAREALEALWETYRLPDLQAAVELYVAARTDPDLAAALRGSSRRTAPTSSASPSRCSTRLVLARARLRVLRRARARRGPGRLGRRGGGRHLRTTSSSTRWSRS